MPTPDVKTPLALTAGRLLLFAPDLVEAERFYREVLELRLLETTDQRISFDCAGFRIDIFKCRKSRTSENHSHEAGAAMAFVVPRIEAAMATLLERGVRLLHQVPAVNATGRYAAFCDPFGIVHELFEPTTQTRQAQAK